MNRLLLPALLLVGALICAWQPMAGIALMGLCLCLALQAPGLLAIAYVALIPFSIPTVPAPSLTLRPNDAMAFAFVLGYLGYKRFNLRSWPVVGWLLVFGAALLVSLMLSPSIPGAFVSWSSETSRHHPNLRGLTYLTWLGMNMMAAWCLYDYCRDRQENFVKIIRTFQWSVLAGTAGGLLLFGLAFLGFRFKITTGGGSRDLVTQSLDAFRLAGFAYEPNMWGLFCSIAFLGCLGILMCDNRTIRTHALLPAVLLSALNLGLTMSASAMGAAFVGLIALGLGILAKQSSRRRGLQALIVGPALALTLMFVTLLLPGDLFFGKVIGKLATGSDPYRAIERRFALNAATEHPMTGVGLQQLAFWAPKYHPAIQSQLPGNMMPPGGGYYTEMLAETGLLGATAFAAMITGIASLAWRRIPVGSKKSILPLALGAAGISILVHAFAVTNLAEAILPVTLALLFGAVDWSRSGLEEASV